MHLCLLHFFFRTEHPAGSFGARHTPHIMRLHEMMGIEQNRRWGVCNLNDFRKVRQMLQKICRMSTEYYMV